MLKFTGTLDRLAEEIVQATRTAVPTKGPAVLSIGGYPYTGKTLLSAEVSRRWAGNAYVLPTESVILTRAGRLDAALDGSSTEAHDVAEIARLIEGLRKGDNLSVHVYDWRTGDFADEEPAPILDTGDLVVVDGSIATSLPVRAQVDISFALVPIPYNIWYRSARDRDVQDRAWDPSSAGKQNASKAETVDAQLLGFGESSTEYLVEVDLSVRPWRARTLET